MQLLAATGSEESTGIWWRVWLVYSVILSGCGPLFARPHHVKCLHLSTYPSTNCKVESPAESIRGILSATDFWGLFHSTEGPFFSQILAFVDLWKIQRAQINFFLSSLHMFVCDNRPAEMFGGLSHCIKIGWRIKTIAEIAIAKLRKWNACQCILRGPLHAYLCRGDCSLSPFQCKGACKWQTKATTQEIGIDNSKAWGRSRAWHRPCPWNLRHWRWWCRFSSSLVTWVDAGGLPIPKA